jgi:hypothetical protein
MFAAWQSWWPIPRQALIEGCAVLAGAEPRAWGMGLMNTTIFVGLDVHKATVAVAVAAELRGWQDTPTGDISEPRRSDRQAGRKALAVF